MSGICMIIYIYIHISSQVLCSLVRYMSVVTAPAVVAEADPCSPGPCGINTQCRISSGLPVCACLPGLVGNPFLGCRPECQRDLDCRLDRSCERQRCVDPCPGTCGRRAACMVLNHRPQCSCNPGYSGDPYVACSPYTRTAFPL